jgi:hypothetical protein
MQSIKDLAVLYAGIACCCAFWYSRPASARRAITQAEKLGLVLVLVAGLLGTMMVVYHLDIP